MKAMKKIQIVFLTAVLFVVLSVTAFAGNGPYHIGVAIPVSVHGGGTVEIRPVANAPDPSEKQLKIKGAESKSFHFTWTEPGIYRYRISQRQGKDKGILYDKSIFLLTTQVKASDTGLTVIHTIESNKGKTEKIQFRNRRVLASRRVPEGDTPASGGRTGANRITAASTGELFAVRIVAMVGILAMGALFAVLMKGKERKRYEKVE